MILMAVLYNPNGDPSRVYYGTDTRAFALLIGALAAIQLEYRIIKGKTTKKDMGINRKHIIGYSYMYDDIY